MLNKMKRSLDKESLSEPFPYLQEIPILPYFDLSDTKNYSQSQTNQKQTDKIPKKPDFIDDVLYKDVSGRPSVIFYLKSKLLAEQVKEITLQFKNYLEESGRSQVMEEFMHGFSYRVHDRDKQDSYEISRYYIGRKLPRREIVIIMPSYPCSDRKVFREYAKKFK